VSPARNTVRPGPGGAAILVSIERLLVRCRATLSLHGVHAALCEDIEIGLKRLEKLKGTIKLAQRTLPATPEDKENP
jgi:hypothetical protein